jgi:RNA polymerase sigma factor (sigma-70 family)
VLLMSVVKRHARTPEHAEWLLELLSLHEGPLLRYAQRLLAGDVERARDVVQDTFLKLCGQPRAKVEGHAREWLFTVCRNRALDVRKKEGRMNADDTLGARASTAPGPVAVVQEQEERSRLLDMVSHLPAKQREVVLLKFQNGYSYKEIARITKHSIGNVGYLLHMAIKTLRGQLEADVALGRGRTS